MVFSCLAYPCPEAGVLCNPAGAFFGRGPQKAPCLGAWVGSFPLGGRSGWACSFLHPCFRGEMEGREVQAGS